MVNFGEFLKSEACGQTVLPDRSILLDKIGGKCQNWKLKCDILGDIQPLCKYSLLCLLFDASMELNMKTKSLLLI